DADLAGDEAARPAERGDVPESAAAERRLQREIDEGDALLAEGRDGGERELPVVGQRAAELQQADVVVADAERALGGRVRGGQQAWRGGRGLRGRAGAGWGVGGRVGGGGGGRSV